MGLSYHCCSVGSTCQRTEYTGPLMGAEILTKIVDTSYAHSRYKVIGVGSPDENNVLNMLGSICMLLFYILISSKQFCCNLAFSLVLLLSFYFFSIFHILQLKMH